MAETKPRCSPSAGRPPDTGPAAPNPPRTAEPPRPLLLLPAPGSAHGRQPRTEGAATVRTEVSHPAAPAAHPVETGSQERRPKLTHTPCKCVSGLLNQQHRTRRWAPIPRSWGKAGGHDARQPRIPVWLLSLRFPTVTWQPGLDPLPPVGGGGGWGRAGDARGGCDNTARRTRVGVVKADQ